MRVTRLRLVTRPPHVVVRRLSAVARAPQVYDVAIVGAGVVGATLACSLLNTPALRDLRVAVIEPRSPAPLSWCAEQSIPDQRVYSISEAGRASLTAAGAWSAIEAAGRAPAFSRMHVWDALGPGSLSFSASDAGAEQLGWVVEGRVLQAALWAELERLAASSRLELLCPATVSSASFPLPWNALPTGSPVSAPSQAAGTNSLAELTLGDGSIVRALLVVAADGANSKVRSLAGIGNWGWDYDQTGVVGTVRVDTSEPNSTAWQRFLPGGPLALLPLSGGLSSIVWSTSPRHAAELLAMPDAQFVSALNAALRAPTSDFRGEGGPTSAEPESAAASGGAGELYERSRDAVRLDPLAAIVDVGQTLAGAVTAALRGRTTAPPMALEAVGKRAAFPLRLSKSNADVRHRLALIGDAAHSMHPLAGQGLNLGLAEAASLTAALARGAAAGADPGSLRVLQAYERLRYSEAAATVLAMDAIKAAFSSPSWANPSHALWVPARNIGMAVLDSLTPAKGLMARVAMGARGGGRG